MPDEHILLTGGKVLVGAAILITFLTMVYAASPQTYPTGEEDVEEPEPSLVEKIKDFITSFPYNFCIGGTLVIVSMIASYYSKIPAVSGEILRTLGPFQGYVFGFGIVLIFVSLL